MQLTPLSPSTFSMATPVSAAGVMGAPDSGAARTFLRSAAHNVDMAMIYLGSNTPTVGSVHLNAAVRDAANALSTAPYAAHGLISSGMQHASSAVGLLALVEGYPAGWQGHAAQAKAFAAMAKSNFAAAASAV